MLYLRISNMRLVLKLFRGEPAISGFDWNFSATHNSSAAFQRRSVRSSMELYLHFNLIMGRSPGFGPNVCNSNALFRLALAAAPVLQHLNLAAYIRSPDRSTKSTISHLDVLYVLVGTGFQVLFHSPPGVLFTFPSQYYTLSVTG